MLSISVTNERQHQRFDHPAGALEFGRGLGSDIPRFVVEDGFVSRDQIRIEELPDNRIQVKNLSTKNPVKLADGTEIPVSASRECVLPVSFMVGRTSIAIGHPNDGPAATPGIAFDPMTTPGARSWSPTTTLDDVSGAVIGAQVLAPTAAPAPLPQEDFAADGYLSLPPVRRQDQPAANAVALGETPAPETLAQWMETVLTLQRSDAAPAQFYTQAARAMVNMIGLDVGLVLLHDDKGWEVVARAANEAEESRRSAPAGREYSQTVLRQVLAEKQTFYQDLALMKSLESLKSIEAVVVSPIFGLDDEVVGALYGMRHGQPRTKVCKIRPLEAQLVQLLAAAIGANLARTVATRTRTQFEQFFPSELVRELARDPALLEGRAQDVTILMSDLRGFSTLSERLGPQDTCRLIRDVMERLSARILEHSGVIVSYLGDGILAMWNAPVRQENHAILACRAALGMLEELPALNAVWEPILGHALGIGIGINTGPVQVGNTGSSRRFMYGPLGNTVNLASRVEGATKHLKVPILVTGSTRVEIGKAFATRRLCQVRVMGIIGAVELYELHGEKPSPDWLAFRDTYEKALALFESGQWLKTFQLLLPLMEKAGQTGHYDHATVKLISRSWECVGNPPLAFDPVLDLASK